MSIHESVTNFKKIPRFTINSKSNEKFIVRHIDLLNLLNLFSFVRWSEIDLFNRSSQHGTAGIITVFSCIMHGYNVRGRDDHFSYNLLVFFFFFF